MNIQSSRQIEMRFILSIAALCAFLFAGCTSLKTNSPGSKQPAGSVNSDPSSGDRIDAFRIYEITPTAAEIGEMVTINYSGATDPEIVLSGMTIAGIPGINKTEISFKVPADAENGPLYLKEGSSTSNAVWFSVSKTYVKTPAEDEVMLDSLGNEVAVNQMMIALKDEYNSYAEAERIAGLVGGRIIGQIPLISAYQLELDSNTLEELDAHAQLLRTDIAVKYAFKNIALSGDSTDWTKDPDYQFQRVNNRVVEGCRAYSNAVHPTNADRTRPIFTSIGIVESDVDFDQEDFDGYVTGRSNNIALYAKDGGGYEDHGSIVSGVVAAEIGDGGMAGLLQGIANAHGGFNIRVEGNKWNQSKFAATARMLEDGARVVNWSFGIHREGAQTSLGQDVENNVWSSDDFAYFNSAAIDVIRKTEKNYPNAVIVTSAGNGNTNAGDPEFRSPSSIVSNNLIVVGAHSTDETPVRSESTSPYSNYGRRVDIAAAGTVKDYDSNLAYGTSFATPLVTATIAAMLSIEPNLTPLEIKRMLRSTAMAIENTVPVSGQPDDVFTSPLTADEVGDESALPTERRRLEKGARLNVEDAIKAAIDKRNNRSVPEGTPIEVDLNFGLGSDVTKTVSVKLPQNIIYDKVDILFLADVSGSYDDDIAQFKSQAAALVDTFVSSGTNVQIGVASFSDFPSYPYGSQSSGDFAYLLNQPLTGDRDKILSAINSLTARNGEDTKESQLEALYQAASGLGRAVDGVPQANIAAFSVGWREGSLPIIFLATDAGFHDSDYEPAYPGAGFEETVNYLNSRHIRIYGLQSGYSVSDVADVVRATGGQHFSLSSDSSEIVAAVESALIDASSVVRVSLRKNGDFANLIQEIDPDFRENVHPGDTLNFDVTFSRKLFLDDKGEYVFSLQLEVVAEEVAIIQVVPVTVRIN